MAMGQMQKVIKLNVGISEDLWPYQVVDEIQKVMEEGLAKYPDAPWLKIPVSEHVVKAAIHLKYHHDGDTSEDHLAHAFTRLMMAVAIERGYTSTVDEFVKRDKEVDDA